MDTPKPTPGPKEDAALQRAAEIALGAPVSLYGRTFVMESVGGTLWQGEVSEFVTQDRRRAYAWTVEREGQPTEYIAYLHMPPIDSALTAFRLWMKGLV
jgi:hypothetical protein